MEAIVDRPAQVEVRVLGAFALDVAGTSVTLPSAAQRLIAFLALAGGPVARSHVAGTLWPDLREDRAAANLRTTMWRCRRWGAQVVEGRGCQLSLAADVDLDLRTAETAAVKLVGSAGEVEPGLSVSDGRALLRRLSMDLLLGWYDDWVIIERERHRQLRLHGLEALCEHLTRIGHHATAVEVGTAAASAEPLRETAHRALIAAHLAEGNVGEAMRQYGRCRRVLRRELGVEPSRDLERMIAAVRPVPHRLAV